MKALRSFGLFWYDFVIGDDWRVAIGVVLALAVSGGLAHAGVPMWWFMPLAVVGIAMVSLRRAVAPPKHREPAGPEG